MEQSKVLAVSELGKPVVHRFDDREDSVTTITEKIADTFLFQFPGRFARPVDQLHVERDKSVPRIAHQEYHMGPASSRAGTRYLPRTRSQSVAFIRCSAKSCE